MDLIPAACDNKPCLNFIAELNFPEISNSRKAQFQILTNGNVVANNSIRYQASQSINLKEEFEVKSGFSFEAHIQPCN